MQILNDNKIRQEKHYVAHKYLHDRRGQEMRALTSLHAHVRSYTHGRVCSLKVAYESESDKKLQSSLSLTRLS